MDYKIALSKIKETFININEKYVKIVFRSDAKCEYRLLISEME